MVLWLFVEPTMLNEILRQIESDKRGEMREGNFVRISQLRETPVSAAVTSWTPAAWIDWRWHGALLSERHVGGDLQAWQKRGNEAFLRA
eukprot:scaffold15316_cov114-Skeletonema_dohrnii-CCMP3373.AAC.7